MDLLLHQLKQLLLGISRHPRHAGHAGLVGRRSGAGLDGIWPGIRFEVVVGISEAYFVVMAAGVLEGGSRYM